MLLRSLLAVLSISFWNLPAADAQSMRAATRGELMYSIHCLACHNDQVHWRDKKVVTDWTSLQTEVSRWQDVSRLGWGDEDIAAVARYLNALYYHYPLSE